MINIINEIFEHYEYKGQKTENGYFYQRNHAEYWVVINSGIYSIIDRQAEYFNKCKELCRDEALDKNLSMLALWETDGNVPPEEFRRTKLNIEENPLFFKKYVLGYSVEQLAEFRTNIGQINPIEVMLNNIASKDIFESYKNNIDRHTWHSLLYRIAIKLPFIRIKISELGNLQSLVSQNEVLLESKGILSFKNKLEDIIREVTEEQIDKCSAHELCIKLQSLNEVKDE